MTPTPENILEWALALPEDDRAMIADGLLQSLEGENDGVDSDIDAAWGVEIQKRLEDLETGRSKALTLDEFRKFVESDDDESSPV